MKLRHFKPDSVKRDNLKRAVDDLPLTYTQALDELVKLHSEIMGVKRERFLEMC